MANSTLDPDNMAGRRDRSLGKGHGTRALGPSDSSDSGSDLQGAPGTAPQVGFDIDSVVDFEGDTAATTAGPDIGDADLDSDTDSTGTGERAGATRDEDVRDGADISPDHIEEINLDVLELEEDLRKPRPRKPH